MEFYVYFSRKSVKKDIEESEQTNYSSLNIPLGVVKNKEKEVAMKDLAILPLQNIEIKEKIGVGNFGKIYYLFYSY